MKNQFLLAGMMLVYGCACTDSYYCPDLSPGGRTLVRLGGRDTLTFTDSSGYLRYDFVVSERKFKPPYAEECRKGDFTWRCNCPDCFTYGQFKAWSTTPAGSPYYYEIYASEYPPPGIKDLNNRSLHLSFMGFMADVRYEDSAYRNVYMPAIVHHETIELNGKQFRDIFVFDSDTLSPDHSNDDVWRVYFSNSDGVIGCLKRFPQVLLTLKHP